VSGKHNCRYFEFVNFVLLVIAYVELLMFKAW
jgi:hypothetical protein